MRILSIIADPQRFFPKVILTHQPLIASPFLHQIPDNLHGFDCDNWALDFHGYHGHNWIDIGLNQMSFTYGARLGKQDALNFAKIMLSELKARFCGLGGIPTVMLQPEGLSQDLVIWRMDPLQQNRYGEVTQNPLSYLQNNLTIVQNSVELCKMYPNLTFQFHYQYLGDQTIELAIYALLRASKSQTTQVYSSIRLLEIYNHNVDDVIWSTFTEITPKDWLRIQENGIYNALCVKNRNHLPYKVLILNEIAKKKMDFSFPRNFGLLKSFIYGYENFNSIPKASDSTQVLPIGQHLEYGICTEQNGTVLVRSLTSHVGVFGLSGSGKTSWILFLINILNQQCPHVGVLMINIAKEDDVHTFELLMDQTIKYSDELFSIPYHSEKSLVCTMKQEDQNRTPSKVLHRSNSTSQIQRSARILSAAMGFGCPIDYIIKILMHEYFGSGGLPDRLDVLLRKVLDYLKDHSYGKDLNQTMRQAFENRLRAIIDDELLIQTTKYQANPPLWFQWWLSGKNIMLDLSQCEDENIQRLLVFLILHMIDVHTKGLNCPDLKNLVVVDEAHRIFQSAPNIDQNDRAVTSAFMGELVYTFMTEFRSRGLGILISDQNPIDLIPIIRKGVSLTVSFTNSRENLAIEEEDVKHILTDIGFYRAFVNNRWSGERYFIATEKPHQQARASQCPVLNENMWFFQKLLNNPCQFYPEVNKPSIHLFLSKKVEEIIGDGYIHEACRVMQGLIWHRFQNLWKQFLNMKVYMSTDLLQILETHLINIKADPNSTQSQLEYYPQFKAAFWDIFHSHSNWDPEKVRTIITTLNEGCIRLMKRYHQGRKPVSSMIE